MTQPPSNNPYGQPTNPYGQPTNPYGQPTNPYGQPTNPYGQPANPYGQPMKPYGDPMAMTPWQGATPYGPFADFGARLGAFLLDSLLMLVAVIPSFVGIALAVSGAPRTTFDPNSGDYVSEGGGSPSRVGLGLAIFGIGVLVAIGLNLWNRVYLQGRTGQSLGKRYVGLALIHAETGRPLGMAWVLLREIVNGVVPFYLGYFWMLWDAKKQTLGDMTATSIVVRVPKGQPVTRG